MRDRPELSGWRSGRAERAGCRLAVAVRAVAVRAAAVAIAGASHLILLVACRKRTADAWIHGYVAGAGWIVGVLLGIYFWRAMRRALRN